jgi:3',5'-cyclic AMP phosphodiesterase CpdA
MAWPRGDPFFDRNPLAMPFHFWPCPGRATRREFLSGLALAGATLAIADESPRRDDGEGPWLALVSDVHVAADPKHKIFGQVPAENLRRVVADILARPRKPEGVVIDGDLALKNGRPGDYATLLALLEPLRKAGVPLHLTLGNHDDRDAFRGAIGGAIRGDSKVEEKQVSSFEAAGRRFVLLDSLEKVDCVPGRLGDAQLAWLGRELDAHKGMPTLVVVHHPPWFLPDQKHPDGLRDADALRALLTARPWVETVIFGHTHRWSRTREDGLDRVNLPAVAYAFNHDQPLGYCRLDLSGGRARFELRDVVRKVGGGGKVYHRRPRHRPPARAAQRV